jgi:hypothetical protein
LLPWRRITKFANQVAGTIAARFPPEEFLNALDIVVPDEWAKAHDTSFYVSNVLVYLMLM